MRNLELDVYHDREGGRYAEPLDRRLMGAQGGEPWAFDLEGELRTPGFKVLHEANFDFETHNYTLESALGEAVWCSGDHD